MRGTTFRSALDGPTVPLLVAAVTVAVLIWQPTGLWAPLLAAATLLVVRRRAAASPRWADLVCGGFALLALAAALSPVLLTPQP